MQSKYSVRWGRVKVRTVAVSPGEERAPHNGELRGHLQSCSELSRPAAACGAVCLKSLFPPSPFWALWQKSLRFLGKILLVPAPSLDQCLI